MIPDERPQAAEMLVTMTKSELAELISNAVNEGYNRAVEAAKEDAAVKAKRSEILVGGREIAKFLGMSERTFYNHLYYSDVFGDAVKRLGKKLYARRDELARQVSDWDPRDNTNATEKQ